MTLSKFALTVFAATSLIALSPNPAFADDEAYESFDVEEDYSPPPSMAQIIMRGVADGLGSSVAPSPRDKAWAEALGAASGLPANFGTTGLAGKPARPKTDNARPAAAGPAKPAMTRVRGCFTTLGHLDAKLPRFNLRELDEVRDAVVGEDLTQALARAKAQGLTSHQAAREALNAANELESLQSRNRQCIHQTHMNPTQAIAEIESGRYRFSRTSLGELGQMEACLANYANFRYGLTGAKEAAVGIACLAAAGE